MPPLAIAAGAAAVGTIGGALISSSAQKKAAKQANETQQDATQAQLQLGRESLGLNKDIYNSNYNLLSPYVSRGNVAGTAYNALLGLPSAPAMVSPLASQTGAPAQPTAALPGAQTGDQGPAHPGGVHAAIPTGTNALAPAQPTTGAVSATPPAPTLTPQQAMQNFANSAGMQFQLKQGENAIQNNYAAHGGLQSGSAMKALQSYGQQTALQNYFMPYMSMVNGQQAMGAQAASAVAGVGTSFGNTAANINGQIGNTIQNGADSAANAAIARGNANANLWNSIGSGIGSVASSFVPLPRAY